MRLIRIAAVSFLGGAIVGCIYAQTCTQTQDRFRYERRSNNDGFYYVEIYEARQQDCDSTAKFIIARTTTIIDRPTRVAQLTAEKQTYVDKAQDVQGRIDALNALP